MPIGGTNYVHAILTAVPPCCVTMHEIPPNTLIGRLLQSIHVMI